MKTRQSLLVADALRDEEWKSNPDIKLGMISYLGFPITWPDGQVFGTICVLDKKENSYSELYRKFVLQCPICSLLWEKRKSEPASKMTLLTLNVTWLRNFVATQHGQRAGISTYKCQIIYSITISAVAYAATLRDAAFTAWQMLNFERYVGSASVN